MTGPLRVLFVDRAARNDWGPQPNRFNLCAIEAARAGLDVTLVTVGEEPDDVDQPSGSVPIRFLTIPSLPYPLVCGRGRALETRPLRDAYTLAQTLRLGDYDVVVAPIQGGLAHGFLMQRATGDISADTRIALWCDAPSRWRALREDQSPADMEPLVTDALEHAALKLADALVYPGAAALSRLPESALPQPAFRAELPAPPMARSVLAAGAPIEIIVFVGPLTRANGALLFMDAVEELAVRGLLVARSVAFIGPMTASGPALSQEMVGIRAQRWDFEFRMIPTCDESRVLRYLSGGNKLAVFAAEDADDDRLLRSAIAAGCPVVATGGYDLTRSGGLDSCASEASALANVLAAHCVHGAPARPVPCPTEPVSWAALLRSVANAPLRQPVKGAPARIVGASVCIVSHDRPAALRQALGSIGPSDRQIDVVLLDNAGQSSPPENQLQGHCLHDLRVLRSGHLRSPATAYNIVAQAAYGEALIFLDDDNILTEGGLERFIRALEMGWFDIVVTTLDIVDGAAATEASAGRFIFLGEARSAGLFFNGFGDRAMAVRREAFLALGGFPDPGHHAAVSDWTFLARAQAAGLRIGVLQQPVTRYARRLDGRDTNWVKRDVEGGRRAVLDAYGSTVDGPLVARFAQGLQLRSF